MPRYAILFSMATCLLFAATTYADDTHLTPQKSAKKIQALQQNIQQLEGVLTQQKHRHTSVSKGMKALEADISKLVSELHDSRKKIVKKSLQLKTLQQKKTTLLQEKNTLLSALEMYFMAAYMAEKSPLNTVFGEGNTAQRARHGYYRKVFYKEQAQKLDQLASAVTALKTVEAKITTKLQTIHQAQQAQIHKKQRLRKTHQQRQKLLASVTAEITGTEQSIAALKQQEAHLKKILRTLLTQSKQTLSGKGIKQHKKHLMWPVKGDIQAYFGKKRLGGLRWNGITLNVAEGSAVNAVFSGRVVFTGWLRGYGLLMIIDHGGKTMSLYGYNGHLVRAKGDQVETGEIIAYSGLSETGKPSAYFGMRINGQPVNPKHWLTPFNK